MRKAFDTFADPPEYELYDLKNDPVEFHNLAGRPEHREVQQRLAQALIEYRKQTDDPFLDAVFLDKFRRRTSTK
ncbi:MAG: DUF4976 domain-containing protein [Planctomycetes bacterium]|nr:DUF4976 domain-containing protein [Planctomycetota bacterium]